MRLWFASVLVLGAAACQPDMMAAPAGPMPVMAADCDLHSLLDDRRFLSDGRARADQRLVAACLAAGPQLEGLNQGGRTPLSAAVSGGDVQSVIKLIAAGADVDARANTAYHPVAAAAIREDPEMLRLLLNAGASPEATGVPDDPHPIATAIWNNDIASTRALIQAGADLTRRDNSNGHDMVERTILSGEDNGEILTMLFQAGMSPTAPLSRGRTPLERVLRLGHEGELRAIVRAGVSLNAPVGQNEGALFSLRSWNTTPAFVRAMVRLGANPAQRNSIGQTPLQAAQRFDPELAVIFRQAGLR